MKPQRDPATKPGVSKYARKVAMRQPPTLLGQKLLEALNERKPGAANTELSEFVTPIIKQDLHHELCTKA